MPSAKRLSRESQGRREWITAIVGGLGTRGKLTEGQHQRRAALPVPELKGGALC